MKTRLNRFGYVVVGSTLLAAGAFAAGRTGYATPSLALASAALWWAMRRNRAERRGGDPRRDRDGDDSRRRRELEVEGLKGENPP